MLAATTLGLSGFAAGGSANGMLLFPVQRHFPVLPPANLSRTPLIYVANSGANSVTAYPVSASGNVAPTITLAGPHTLLQAPFAIAHDRLGELFVASATSILVFARGADGDAAPLRSLAANCILMENRCLPAVPTSLAVDAKGYTYVGVAPEFPFNEPTVCAVSVFAPGAGGSDKPLRTFAFGSFSYPVIGVNARGELYDMEGIDRESPGALSGYSSFATGNVTLAYRPINFDAEPLGIAVSPRSGDVYLLKLGDGIAPAGVVVMRPNLKLVVSQIDGPATGLAAAASGNGMTVGSGGEIYVATDDVRFQDVSRINVFLAGARGNVAPSRIIAGPSTGLSAPVAITIVGQ